MSFNNIKTKSQSERGFTIVELLIVIVVIGILAAITIVSFNGVTARANATSAKAAAASAIKKAEAYNAEKNAYPTAPSQLTGAAATESFAITGVTFNNTAGSGSGTTLAPPTAAPTSTQGPATINFFNCTTGARFDYWDYAATAANKWTPVYTGGADGTNCPGTTYIKV